MLCNLGRALGHLSDLASGMLRHLRCDTRFHVLDACVYSLGREDLAHILLLSIDYDPYRPSRNVTAKLQPARGGAVDDEYRFENERAGLEVRRLKRTQRGVSKFSGDHHVHSTGDHWVFPSQEMHVLVRQRLGAIVGTGDPALRQTRKTVAQHMVTRVHDYAERTVRLQFDAKIVEHAVHIIGQLERPGCVAYGANGKRGLTGVAGIEFEQRIPPLL